MKQATYWYAQLTDGTKIRGGQQNYYPNDANIQVVPIPALKIFSICHNTYTDQYYQPWDQWYLARVAADFPYPSSYVMGDGTILTVDKDHETGLLILTQTQYTG